jgi:hypothetical protein
MVRVNGHVEFHEEGTYYFRSGRQWIRLDAMPTSTQEARECLESLALMYHAYLMTDAFLWCYRDTLSEGFRIVESQTPEWLVRFTPDVVAEWNRVLTRCASAWRVR